MILRSFGISSFWTSLYCNKVFRLLCFGLSLFPGVPRVAAYDDNDDNDDGSDADVNDDCA